MNTSKGRVQSAHEPRYQERPTAADSAVGTEVACPYCMVEVRTRLAEAERLLDEASPRQECDGCGREFRWHQMFVEEGDRWECAECWDRCEKAERAAMRDRHDDK